MSTSFHAFNVAHSVVTLAGNFNRGRKSSRVMLGAIAFLNLGTGCHGLKKALAPRDAGVLADALFVELRPRLPRTRLQRPVSRRNAFYG